MRELKFRAMAETNLQGKRFIYSSDGLAQFWSLVEALKLTPEQFTGRLDTKGREIYEGDIVKSTYTKSDNVYAACKRYPPVKQGDTEQTAEVVCENTCSWSWGRFNNIDQALTYEDRKFEIIGNIHESE